MGQGYVKRKSKSNMIHYHTHTLPIPQVHYLVRPQSSPTPTTNLFQCSLQTASPLTLQHSKAAAAISSGAKKRQAISLKSSVNEMEFGGLDSDGREFKNAEEMWREQVGDPQMKTQWYTQGITYWQGVEATVDGVLGGYGHVNDADINASEDFLNTLLAEKFPDSTRDRHLVALDCGSGIGRVTKNLLIRYFNEVDLLEPVSHFLETARVNLAPENLMVSDKHKAANFYCVPLQEFTPDSERYDIIWIQWCIGHLSDDDLLSFFNRAKSGLKPGGLFVLKENIARSGFVLDKEDKSITRSDSYFKELFNRCGLHIYKFKDQKEFPDELFAVKMYALTSEVPKRVIKSKSKRQIIRPGIIT